MGSMDDDNCNHLQSNYDLVFKTHISLFSIVCQWKTKPLLSVVLHYSSATYSSIASHLIGTILCSKVTIFFFFQDQAQNSLQEKFSWLLNLFAEYHPSSIQMMCGVNFMSCLLTSSSLIQQGGISYSLNFAARVRFMTNHTADSITLKFLFLVVSSFHIWLRRDGSSLGYRTAIHICHDFQVWTGSLHYYNDYKTGMSSYMSSTGTWLINWLNVGVVYSSFLLPLRPLFIVKCRRRRDHRVLRNLSSNLLRIPRKAVEKYDCWWC